MRRRTTERQRRPGAEVGLHPQISQIFTDKHKLVSVILFMIFFWLHPGGAQALGATLAKSAGAASTAGQIYDLAMEK